jgi:hypothetical protein
VLWADVLAVAFEHPRPADRTRMAAPPVCHTLIVLSTDKEVVTVRVITHDFSPKIY